MKQDATEICKLHDLGGETACWAQFLDDDGRMLEPAPRECGTDDDKSSLPRSHPIGDARRIPTD